MTINSTNDLPNQGDVWTLRHKKSIDHWCHSIRVKWNSQGANPSKISWNVEKSVVSWSTNFKLRKLVQFYAFKVNLHPTFDTLAATIMIPEMISKTPQNASRPSHPRFRMAPAMGLPMSKPNEIGTKSMPERTPTTPMEGESVTITVGGRETKVPEKNLSSRQHLSIIHSNARTPYP